MLSMPVVAPFEVTSRNKPARSAPDQKRSSNSSAPSIALLSIARLRKMITQDMKEKINRIIITILTNQLAWSTRSRMFRPLAVGMWILIGSRKTGFQGCAEA